VQCGERGEEANPNYLQDLRLHDMRHEATSSLFERGLAVIEVASITGHKSLAMLSRYTHLANSHLIEKLG
jgi:site-specific recombinase XerD